MRTAEQWLNEYAITHRHPTNKRIHFICVPLILWSVLALMWVLSKPVFAVFVAMALAFYLRLGFRYFLGMFTVAVLVFATIVALQALEFPLAQVAIVVFVLAWIGQFYGHKIEGQKPSFFEDLLFLLIGPLWIVNQMRRQPPVVR